MFIKKITKRISIMVNLIIKKQDPPHHSKVRYRLVDTIKIEVKRQNNSKLKNRIV